MAEGDNESCSGLETTREVRTRISREHGNDPRRLGAYYLEYQQRFTDRLRERLRWTESGSRPPNNRLERTGFASRSAWAFGPIGRI